MTEFNIEQAIYKSKLSEAGNSLNFNTAISLYKLFDI